MPLPPSRDDPAYNWSHKPADHNAAGLYIFGPHGDDNPLARLLKYQHCSITAASPDAERLQRVRYRARAAERGELERAPIATAKMVLIGAYWKLRNRPTPAGKRNRVSRMTKTGRVVVLGLAAAIVGSGLWSSRGRYANTGLPEPEHDVVDAYGMCHEFLEERLRAPATVKYPDGGSGKYTTPLGDGRYRVRSHVDAQNGFGALIRSDYDCTVQYVGNRKWRLDSLSVTSR